MKITITSLIIGIVFYTQFLNAQDIRPATGMPTDTFRVIRNKIFLGETRLRSLKDLHSRLEKAGDPEINAAVKASKTTETVSLIASGLGAVLMGIGGYNSLSGNLDNEGLYIGGGLLMLGGGAVGLVGASRRKKAMSRYNLLLGPDGLTGVQSVGSTQGRDAVGAGGHNSVQFSTGWGWSKQRVNYDFDQPFLNARVFSAGLVYGMPLNEKWEFQTGLALTQHGFRVENNTTSNGVKVQVKADARLRYLELPATLRYKLPVKADKWTFHLSPGLYAGYAVSGKAVARGEGENRTRKVRTAVSDKIVLENTPFGDRIDAGLTLGATASFGWGPGSAFAGIRYYLGLLNLEGGDNKAFNRTVYLNLGYRYGLR